MRCPKCNSLNTRVVDSRLNESETQRRRRHECNSCGDRFTTCEIYHSKLEALEDDFIKDAEKVHILLEKLRKMIKEGDGYDIADKK